MIRIVFVITVALGGAMMATLAPAGQKAPAFKATVDETKVWKLTNDERKKKDAPPLRLNPTLSKIARAHSENMAKQGKMEHTLDEKTAFDRIRAAGYRFLKAGENIAAGEDGASLEGIMRAWMDSEGHRANILLTEFTEIGIGIARDKKGQMYFTQVFAKPRK